MDKWHVMRLLVRGILEKPERYNWSVQGFGMLRMYPSDDKVLRVNVWHSAMAKPNVSTIHDHPWHFTSWILSGKMTNLLYDMGHPAHRRMWRGRIKTGPGGSRVDTPVPVRLRQIGRHIYHPGSHYYQSATEIHETLYTDGTVTINARERQEDGEHAYVFWPQGEDWVDAEPRAATLSEVRFAAQAALETFHAVHPEEVPSDRECGAA